MNLLQLMNFKNEPAHKVNSRKYAVSSSSGFTLIEMLIGILIMGIAISMVSVAISQSVRNQEKMQDLLDIYEVALTSKSKVIERVIQQELSGSFNTGNVTVSWSAEITEEASEASIFLVDLGQYSSPNFNIKFYTVTTTIESPYARRVYQFTHMVEQDKTFTTIRGGR